MRYLGILIVIGFFVFGIMLFTKGVQKTSINYVTSMEICKDVCVESYKKEMDYSDLKIVEGHCETLCARRYYDLLHRDNE